MCTELRGWFPWNRSRSAGLSFPSQPQLGGFGEVWPEASLAHWLHQSPWKNLIFGNPARASVEHPEVLAGAWLSPRHSDTAANSWWSISSGGDKLRERFNCRAWMFVLPSGVELMSRKEWTGYKWHFPTCPYSRAFAFWTAQFQYISAADFSTCRNAANFHRQTVKC